MSRTYLLAWNPKRWDWDSKDLSRKLSDISLGKIVTERWSCGSTKSIKKGDRVFLVRLGLEPRGIFGAGIVTSEVFEGPHWNVEKNALGATSLFIEFQYTSLYDPESDNILSRDILKNDPRLSKMHWDTQSSGIHIPEEIALNLEKIWEEFRANDEFFLPEEVHNSNELIEGAKKQIVVNAYERNAAARKLCIKVYGTQCAVCKFDFAQTYGDIGEGFIHVHHVKPLHEIGESYIVDPIKDLRPVCPNCHAIIHKRNPPFTIVEVQNLMPIWTKEKNHD